MALIKCTECGKEFSDKAATCPNCGCPTEYVIQAIENARKETESKKCPFCGSEDIDADGYCNECGMKIPVEKKTEEQNTEPEQRPEPGFYVKCPKCRAYNPTGTFICPKCNYKIEKWSEYQKNCVQVKEKFYGVYRMHLFGKKEEVYCPRCGSADCSIYHEQKVIPGKSKTSYTMNLNPLKPFTLFNKKEKVIKQDKIVTESKFVCNSCGHIFY